MGVRRPDWEQRLSALITEWQYAPFKWGQRDCAQLAHGVLIAVSARDWAQLGTQPYKTARGAQALLRRLDVPDMPALASKLLGAPLPGLFAQRGDLIACTDKYGAALGVCLGAQIALPGAQGLHMRALNNAFSCWRI